MIPWLAKALFAVLDGLRGAVADAGHAVGAVLPPDGFPVLQGDVVGGAAPDALTAAGTGISGCEGICFYKAGIEDGIHRPAHKAVIELPPGWRKGPVFPDGGDRAVYVRLRSGHDLPGFLHLRGVEHGDVVLRHDDLRRAHADEALRLAETAVVAVGIADLAAAGHDEPRPLRTGQLRVQQPVLHDAGDPPGVGGRDDHQPLPGLHRGGVSGLDAVIQAQQRLAQPVGNAPGRVAAVPGAGKVKNHINALVNLFYIQGILNNLIIDKGLNYLGKKNDLYESKNERFF